MSADINVKLSVSGINKAIAELEKYKMSLHRKNETFVKLLADSGVQVAEITASSANDHFSKQLAFGMKPGNASVGFEYIIYGTASPETVKWYVTGADGQAEERSDVVSPILMAEYGSGNRAISGTDIGGLVIGGQGTLNTYGHAFQNEWWFATKVGDDGKPTGWVRATGTKPSRPMYEAMEYMVSIVENTANFVFGGKL